MNNTPQATPEQQRQKALERIIKRLARQAVDNLIKQQQPQKDKAA